MSVQDALKLGAKIQQTRRCTGKELCAIADEICVSKSYLTAIEEGRFDALPAFPFAIGFVRAFAGEIGMDANEVAAEFKAIVQPVIVEEPESDLESSDQLNHQAGKAVKRGPIYGGVAVVLSALSAAWMIFIGGGQQAAYVRTAPPKEAIQYVTSTEQATQQDSVVSVKDDTNKSAVETYESIEANESVEEDFAPANNQLMGVANADDEGASDLDLQVTEVMFQARQDTWVRVSSGDSVLFEGVLHSGDHYVPPMGPALNLTTSNAGGLSLYIGEHDLGVLGSKGAIIENAKIDPDSLILRLVETL